MWSGTTSVGSVTIPSGKRGKSLSGISRGSLSAGGARIEGVGGTALVWIRRDLRVHDHPPLAAALARFDRVVPAFCMHPGLVHGRFESPARVWFLLESLQELRESLRACGSDLVFREGDPAVELVSLVGEVDASAAFFASDVSPYAVARDRRVRAALEATGVEVAQTPGNFVADVSVPRTKAGRPFTVFSPFHRAWRELERREVHPAPSSLPALPPGVPVGRIPTLDSLGLAMELPDPLPAGEAAGRGRMEAFLADGVASYADNHNRLSGGTSVL